MLSAVPLAAGPPQRVRRCMRCETVCQSARPAAKPHGDHRDLLHLQFVSPRATSISYASNNHGSSSWLADPVDSPWSHDDAEMLYVNPSRG